MDTKADALVLRTNQMFVWYTRPPHVIVVWMYVCARCTWVFFHRRYYLVMVVAAAAMVADMGHLAISLVSIHIGKHTLSHIDLTAKRRTGLLSERINNINSWWQWQTLEKYCALTIMPNKAESSCLLYVWTWCCKLFVLVISFFFPFGCCYVLFLFGCWFFLSLNQDPALLFTVHVHAMQNWILTKRKPYFSFLNWLVRSHWIDKINIK